MQRDAVEHRLDVRRHVVGTLDVVDPGRVFRRQAVERGGQVGLHVGIGVLLDGERGGGVAQKDKQRALARLALRDEIRGLAR